MIVFLLQLDKQLDNQKRNPGAETRKFWALRRTCTQKCMESSWVGKRSHFLCVCILGLSTPSKAKTLVNKGNGCTLLLRLIGSSRLNDRNDFMGPQHRTWAGVETTLSYVFMGLKVTWVSGTFCVHALSYSSATLNFIKNADFPQET